MTHIQNAIITDASLSIADHGILSGWLTLDYGGSAQGFGGYCLATTIKRELKEPSNNYAGVWIRRCIEIAGVEKWSSIVGQPIRVRQDNPFGRIEMIGHIIKDDWFDPKELFEIMKKASGHV